MYFLFPPYRLILFLGEKNATVLDFDYATPHVDIMGHLMR